MIHQALDILRHLDLYLNPFAAAHPVGVYALLALIIFCETGLVVTPFLPGDTLLFFVGSMAATAGSPIHLPLAIILLCLAANCGDILNYCLGYRIGPKVFHYDKSWLLNKKHLIEAQNFYDRHGRKTIIIARFVPIIRTFAPFVAGIGRMPFRRFVGFSVFGGMLWVVLISLAGYFFGQLAPVKKHFELVILAIVFVSIIPIIVHNLPGRKRRGFDPIINPPA